MNSELFETLCKIVRSLPSLYLPRLSSNPLRHSITDLLQVLSILTMERPLSFSSEHIRDEKVKVLRSIPPIVPNETILGQYVATTLANGEQKPGYLDDDTVPQGSTCPTFAGVVLHLENPRWAGVPFIFKAGKGEYKLRLSLLYEY